MSPDEEKKLSRRQFIKGTATVGMAVAVAGALGAPVSTSEAAGAVPEKWDKEADVVVVGYGGAGAATAITANDAGAKVLVLEKMPKGGGNTAVSGGGFLGASNIDDAITYISSLYKYSASEMDADLVKVYAGEIAKNVDWIKSLRKGQEVLIYGYAGYPKAPGAKSVAKYHALTPDGKDQGSISLWDLLSTAVEKDRKVEVMLETPAKRLIANAKGEVIGVYAESKGKQIAIKAKRAVVLTTGGHEFNEAMLKSHSIGWPIHSFGNPGNTGDGTKMAMDLGAAIWHMNGLSCPLGFKAPEFEAAFFTNAVQPGFIYVDKHGNRFVNEKGVEAHAWYLTVNEFSPEELQFPRIPCYYIFDEKTRLAGAIGSTSIGYNRGKYTWSKDNSEEVKKGWIVKGDTIKDLATKIKIDPAALEATVAKWNKDIKEGKDTLFGRPIKPAPEEQPAYIGQELPIWSAPLETPPFYSLELTPALLNTQGGPRRNVKGQIITNYGEVIPRLYSSGELGCMWGIIYQGAGNIGECFAFGRISGRNAAAEKPWDAAV